MIVSLGCLRDDGMLCDRRDCDCGAWHGRVRHHDVVHWCVKQFALSVAEQIGLVAAVNEIDRDAVR
jgi:hypothetical protein